MLADQRQARTMDQLRRKGGARITGLVEILGVSDMTVRRDLTRLDTRGAVQKVHGGAVLSATADRAHLHGAVRQVPFRSVP